MVEALEKIDDLVSNPAGSSSEVNDCRFGFCNDECKLLFLKLERADDFRGIELSKYCRVIVFAIIRSRFFNVLRSKYDSSEGAVRYSRPSNLRALCGN